MSLKFLKGANIEGDLRAVKRSIVSELSLEDFSKILKRSNHQMH